METLASFFKCKFNHVRYITVTPLKFKINDVGIIPLSLSLPFMFYPMVLSGDTQPWILISALIAFFTFRTNTFINKRDVILIVLALLCTLAYVFRGDIGYGLLRHAYTYIAFSIFWIVCQREKGDFFPAAIKITVVVWFVIGLYQFIAIKMGYQIDIPGRFLAGRMGPPSLTAEASYYGSLSIIQLMFLLSEGARKNYIYIVMAVSSVLLSGSLLSIILLVFPLMRLPVKFRVAVIIFLPLLLIGDFYFYSSGVVSRLVNVFSGGVNIEGFLLDASLNLRAGHIYFTLIENLLPSLFWVSPIDFMYHYNNFAWGTGILISTSSDYILPAIGEMLYGSGIFAIFLLMVLFNRVQKNCHTRKQKIEKVLFIVACMMNPISISNIFLIIYISQKDK